MIRDEVYAAINVVSKKSHLIPRKDIEYEIEGNCKIYPMLMQASPKWRRLIITRMCNQEYEKVFINPPCWDIDKPTKEKMLI